VRNCYRFEIWTACLRLRWRDVNPHNPDLWRSALLAKGHSLFYGHTTTMAGMIHWELKLQQAVPCRQMAGQSPSNHVVFAADLHHDESKLASFTRRLDGYDVLVLLGTDL